MNKKKTLVILRNSSLSADMNKVSAQFWKPECDVRVFNIHSYSVIIHFWYTNSQRNIITDGNPLRYLQHHINL